MTEKIPFIKGVLDSITTTFVGLMPYSLIAVGIFALAIFFAFLFWQTDSKVEKEATNANINATIQNSQTNVQERVVDQATESAESAEKTSTEARKQRDKAKNVNTTNTNYDRANQERCLTFPSSKECQ